MLKQSFDYAQRVLIAVSGMTPQILTETVYALATKNPSFLPTKLIILTTTVGKRNINQKIFGADLPLKQLCDQFDIPLNKEDVSIELIASPDGNAIEDITNEDENVWLADAITHTLVKTLNTYQDDCAIHMTLAGGRKTMSFYAGYAMSLLGRPQDRLSHVLVDSRFENIPDFYFPTQAKRQVSKNIHKDGTTQTFELRASDAKVMLAEIPFVRMYKIYKNRSV